MSDQLFQTDLFTTDQGNGCAVCCGHDHLTADCPHGQAMTLGLADATDAVTRYGFERTADGVKCKACGGTWRAVNGSIMRGHAKRCAVNPRDFPIPGVCDA